MITDEQIQANLTALEDVQRYRHIERLGEISRRAFDDLRVADGIRLGLPEIDNRTRGFRPNDLVLITGFAHSGKTQLVNTMILNNPDKRIIFFTLDDPATMILTKLLAMYHRRSAEDLERFARQGDDEVEKVYDEAERLFPNLIIVDKAMNIAGMQEAIDEAVDYWDGEKPHAVVVDYLELVPLLLAADEGASIKAKATELQGWAKRNDWPTIVLHQGTRSNARPGEPITIMSVAFGGEQQATILIGVRRPKDASDMEEAEREGYYADKISIHVVKNKRPGGKNTPYEGLLFTMDSATGRIYDADAPIPKAPPVHKQVQIPLEY